MKWLKRLFCKHKCEPIIFGENGMTATIYICKVCGKVLDMPLKFNGNQNTTCISEHR